MGRVSLSEIRRKEIVVAFYKLAEVEGLENASIAKTANVIGINPSLIMHYFKTKEDLIYELVEYILDKYSLIFKIPTRYNSHPEKKLDYVLNNIFSDKWNTLFDDSVSYSCYALTFRNTTIKRKYKVLLDSLRSNLEQLIKDCNDTGILCVKDPAYAANWIFTLVDGAYYYLSLIENKSEYKKKLRFYKEQAKSFLGMAASH